MPLAKWKEWENGCNLVRTNLQLTSKGTGGREERTAAIASGFTVRKKRDPFLNKGEPEPTPYPRLPTGKSCYRCKKYSTIDRYIYILLSPYGQGPSSRLLAHSRARYDLESTRDLWRGETNVRGLFGWMPFGRSPCSSRDVCVAPLCLEVIRKPEEFPLRGLGPARTDRVGGAASVAISRLGPLLLA